MKKTIAILSFILIALSFFSTSAQDSTDYYSGKWNVMIKETPNGDVTMPMRFVKEDASTYKGYFIDQSGEEKEMDNVSLEGGKLNLAFFVAGYDVSMDLAEVNENEMKGMVMNMLEAVASRDINVEELIEVEEDLVEVEKSYFIDTWSVFIEGTPNGDVTLEMGFEQDGDEIKGFVINPVDQSIIEMSSVVVSDDQVNAGFSMMGYDLSIMLQKEDDKVATGSLMDMFTATATRKE